MALRVKDYNLETGSTIVDAYIRVGHVTLSPRSDEAEATLEVFDGEDGRNGWIVKDVLVVRFILDQDKPIKPQVYEAALLSPFSDPTPIDDYDLSIEDKDPRESQKLATLAFRKKRRSVFSKAENC